MDSEYIWQKIKSRFKQHQITAWRDTHINEYSSDPTNNGDGKSLMGFFTAGRYYDYDNDTYTYLLDSSKKHTSHHL